MKYSTLLYLFLAFLFGCSDILVPDISDDQVVLVAPLDGLVTQTQQQAFFWDYLDDADHFNLRIVSPRFDSIIELVLDTTIGGNRFDFTLSKGCYEWNVVALNDAWSSACCETRMLTIDTEEGNDLTIQQLSILSPGIGSALNETNILFSWSDLESADQYVFQTGNADFSEISVHQETNNNFLTSSFSTDGNYNWRVRAENDASQTFTPWSNGQFSIDRIAPPSPVLISPSNGDTLILANQNPDLRWSAGIDVVHDTLYLFSDQNQSTILLKALALEQEFDFDNSGNNLPSGAYFWKAVSIDGAGNASPDSELRLFYIQ